MPHFTYPFSFSEDDSSQVNGCLELEEPLPYNHSSQGGGFYRPGKIVLDGNCSLDLVLYHNDATSAFIYTRDGAVDPRLLEIAGLSSAEISRITHLELPGQLCMGADRTRLIGRAVRNLLGSPTLRPTLASYRQENLAIFPIAREGLKYQVAEALFENYGFYCDEIILDAHHVFDSSVPVYNRKVEMTVFKDKDLNQFQHDNVHVAFIADSIASGLVMKEVIARIQERFENIRQIEVIAPLATVRGLCRIARADTPQGLSVRLHVFETLLNALPPDFYYSAHYNIPELHIRPDHEARYRAWWGEDREGRAIADTACAGYGWSEVFFSPRKQIEMMNAELGQRHAMTIAEILRRNMR